MAYDTETRLREALSHVADEVAPEPSYARTKARWQRSERRRKLVVALTALLIVGVSDGIGLWVLNQNEGRDVIIFDSGAETPNDGRERVTVVNP